MPTTVYDKGKTFEALKEKEWIPTPGPNWPGEEHRERPTEDIEVLLDDMEDEVVIRLQSYVEQKVRTELTRDIAIHKAEVEILRAQVLVYKTLVDQQAEKLAEQAKIFEGWKKTIEALQVDIEWRKQKLAENRFARVDE